MNKLSFITQTEYTHRTKANGIKTGVFRTVVQVPKIEGKLGQNIIVGIEHFMDSMEPDIDLDGNPTTVLKPFLLNTEMLAYTKDEFNQIAIDNNISFDTAVYGPFGVLEEIFPVIADLLVRSGGSKQLGTFGVDPLDWIITPNDYPLK